MAVFLDRMNRIFFLMDSKATQKITQKATQRQKAILEYLKKYPNSGREELALHIADITIDGVKYNLKRLQKISLLQLNKDLLTEFISC